jgi:preprotein translocase subunit SecB
MTDEPIDRPVSPSPIKLAIPVSERVDIKQVFIIQSKIERVKHIEVREIAWEIKQSFKADPVEVAPELNEIAVNLSFALEADQHHGDLKHRTIHIQATFGLLYAISSMDGINESNLNAFAITNGVYNAWPYWREYVQSSTARMGVPPIVLSVFRFPPPRPRIRAAIELSESTPPETNLAPPSS